MSVEFNPIQCTKRIFDNLIPQDGFLYFLTDTKQLMLGKENGKYVEMCGGTNILYGIKDIEYLDNGLEPDPNVDFFVEQIEELKMPLINDLILNKDGCFYRVKSIVDNEIIKTTRVTLQGSGAPGGGGSGGGSSSASVRLGFYNGQNKYFSSENVEAKLGFIVSSSDSSNYISTIELSWDDTFSSPFKTYNEVNLPLDEPQYVDIVDYFAQMNPRGTRVYLRITDKYGTMRSHYYTVYIVKMQMTTNEDDLLNVVNDELTYTNKIEGNATLSDIIVKYQLFDEQFSIAHEESYEPTSAQLGTGITKILNLSEVPHGIYTLKVSSSGYAGGQKIESNEFIHKVLLYKEDIGTPLFGVLIANKQEQYTDIPVSFMLAYGETKNIYNVDIKVDDELITTQQVEASTVNTYNLNFDSQGEKVLQLNVAELNLSFRTVLNVKKYSGELPVISVDRDDLRVYLSAKGRTNNTLDKEFWPNLKNPSQKGILSNFHFRGVNGWMTDVEGNSYLKVSQGAKVEFKDYSPFDYNNDSIKEKGLTIELDFMIDSIFDYNANLLHCLSYETLNGEDVIKTGFAIKGDKFKYYVNRKEQVSLDLVPGKRIKLSYVIESSKNQKHPLCLTYLNGIVSNIAGYSETDDFYNEVTKPAYLTIDSTAGQMLIYGIRFYSAELSSRDILNNYQASLSSLSERQYSYEQNKIYSNNKISLEAIAAADYKLTIPYVKIYGGYQADKSFKMADKATNNQPSLPTGKKTFKAIDIEVVYPKASDNDYFKEYNNFSLTTTFDNPELDVMTGFGKTAQTGAIMYAQGTSSMEYPVKNLRVKFKGKKIKVKPEYPEVDLVCFKADFMESSGSHNTGAANYVDALYEDIGISTPGQDHFTTENEKIVTAIKGHPCIIFWNKGIDENGNILDKNDLSAYEFIGKYNLNLDKATPEPFGFNHDDSNFGYEVDEEGNLILNEKGEKINSIYCFEFLDNFIDVCNFVSDDEAQELTHEDGTPLTEQEKYRHTWYDERYHEDEGWVTGWRMGFESRYPEDATNPEDADVLYELASWINNLYAMRYIEGKEEEALKKFRDEYQGYLDESFLLTYYNVTNTLMMVDSRVKNMMIATWGKEHRTWKDSDGIEHSKFGYIWYPIFYDMDTMLGLDNKGYVNKNYYDEDIDNELLFNGEEILWNFVRDALPDLIAINYNTIEQSGSKKMFRTNTIIPYFNDNQATMANETIYNEDAFYKYVRPYRNGYQDDSQDGKWIDAGTAQFMYAAQGSRAMMREFFVKNRINYLRGKYISSDFQENDRMVFRVSDDESMDSDSEVNVVLTPLRSGYGGFKVGAKIESGRFIGTEPLEFGLKVDGASGTEAYILGFSNLSSTGDLSKTYMYGLDLTKAGDNYLKQFILGNHDKNYDNIKWKNQVAALNLDTFKYLEEFNLENCKSFTQTVEMSGCSQIKRIYMTGSSADNVVLPVGGVLEELRLPDTLVGFTIDSHPNLFNNNFTIGKYNYEEEKYENNFSGLTTVQIINTPNIDSYAIAKVCAHQLAASFKFIGINWTLSASDDFTYNENGSINGIDVLDKLIVRAGNNLPDVSGTLTIDIANVDVNEFDIYQKYHSKYPNLIINYSENAKVEKAIRIKFYNTSTIAASTEPYYTVLSNGNYNLAVLTSAEGPNGTLLTNPIKQSTNTQTFEFANKWIDIAEDRNTEILVSDFINIEPKYDMQLVPVFNEFIRKYTINYIIDEAKTLVEYEYNDKPINNENTIWYATKDDSGLEWYQRYAFKGWMNDSGKIIDLNNLVITQNLDLYAQFEKEDCREIATDLKYFDFEDISVRIPGKENIQKIYYGISIKPEYLKTLGGKITLPNKVNGKDVTVVRNLNGNITHLFFLNKMTYEMIGTNNNNGIYNISKLIEVYFPENVSSLKYIGDNGFSLNIALTKIHNLPDSIEAIGNMGFGTNGNLLLTKLPSKLKYLGSSAFVNCPKISINNIPQGVTEILSGTFQGCSALNIVYFGNNGEETLSALQNNITSIGAYAFVSAGGQVSNIEIGSSITFIDENAMKTYGKNLGKISVIEYSDFLNNENMDTYFPNRITTNIVE